MIDYDEQVGHWIARGGRLWIAPVGSSLPAPGEEPAPPWFYVGELPPGYDPLTVRPVRRPR